MASIPIQHGVDSGHEKPGPTPTNPAASPEPPIGTGAGEGNGAATTGSSQTPPPPEVTTTDWSDDVDRSRFSAWRVAVGERLQWLQAELDDRGGAEPPTGVLAAMRIAHRSTRASTSVATWYSGAHIERSWRALHLAEARVIASSADLPGRLPAIRERVLEDLDAKDQRFKALAAVRPANIGANERSAVAEALRAAYATSDNSHTAVRSLRNRLVLFGLLMLGLNVVLGVLSSVFPNLLPLCVKDFCATGGAVPAGGDVWLVQLLGALGGAVAVVILLLRTRPSVVAYTLTPYQAYIKIMLGAVLAVVGVLIASTGVLQGIVANRPALLVLALILGYSQQVGTRFLDSYADTVVGKAQPKASDQ